MEAEYTNIGVGRGVIKSGRVQENHIDVYRKWCEKPSKFEKQIHLQKDEFDYIINELQFHGSYLKLKESPWRMSFENKILLGMYYVIAYPGSKILAELFGVSGCYVSKVLDEILPILVDYFEKFIPNKKINSSHSKLSRKIMFIIDNTIHKTRRPRVRQSRLYNGHYKTHGYLTQLLVDYDGYIVAYRTMIPGRHHDSLIATYNKHFKKIVGNKLVLGDPGFEGVSYVVAGYRPTEINSRERELYYLISKKEQVLIEHINCFFKKCKSVNKEDCFIDNQKRLLACIKISLGLYNYKRGLGYYHGNQ